MAHIIIADPERFVKILREWNPKDFLFTFNKGILKKSHEGFSQKNYFRT